MCPGGHIQTTSRIEKLDWSPTGASPLASYAEKTVYGGLPGLGFLYGLAVQQNQPSPTDEVQRLVRTSMIASRPASPG